MANASSCVCFAQSWTVAMMPHTACSAHVASLCAASLLTGAAATVCTITNPQDPMFQVAYVGYLETLADSCGVEYFAPSAKVAKGLMSHPLYWSTPVTAAYLHFNAASGMGLNLATNPDPAATFFLNDVR